MMAAGSSRSARSLKVDDLTDTRAAAWGDFNADGNSDLYVGFTRRSGAANKLYHNDGHGKFVDVAKDLGVDVKGETRQISWIDFDNDGRLDLFIALSRRTEHAVPQRGQSLRRCRQGYGRRRSPEDRGRGVVRLQPATAASMCSPPIRTARLNGLYRNDGNRFVDVAHDLGMDAFGRPSTNSAATVRASPITTTTAIWICSSAGYGANFLFHNDGGGKFTNVAESRWVSSAAKRRRRPTGATTITTDAWISTCRRTSIKPVNEKDYLFHNDGDRFTDAIPPELVKHGATHGILWADFDGDGALDLGDHQ